MGKTMEEVLAGLTGKQMRAMTHKAWKALGGKEKGEDGVRQLLASEVMLVAKKRILPLFDRNGRGIFRGVKEGFLEPNRNVRFEVVAYDAASFKDCLGRSETHLNGGEQFIEVVEFQAKCEAARASVLKDKHVRNIFRGPHFPFAIPKREIADLGTDLDGHYLVAVGTAYEAQYPGRRFYNNLHGNLAEQVTVVEGSRHDQLLAALAQGPVVGWYFPCFQGFPVPACLEFVKLLPERFLLTGAIEPAVVEVMHPALVARDSSAPCMDCAAVRWRSHSLAFRADDDRLVLGDRNPNANDDCASGLVVLG